MNAPGTVFDEVGNVQTVSGAFRKADLCQEHGLQVKYL